jgi:hypothetical protein
METKDNKNTVNYAALKKALAAGAVVILGGVAYYVTAWKIKNDIVKPALKTAKEEAGAFLTSWATKDTETK